MALSSHSHSHSHSSNSFLINSLLNLSHLPSSHLLSLFNSFSPSLHLSNSSSTSLSQNNNWPLTISSLLNDSHNPLNSLAARLALSTLQQDFGSLFSLGPSWLAASQLIIARNPPPPPSSLSAAIDLALYILQAGARSPEFARENCDPKTISGMARALLLLSAPEIDQLAVRALGLRTLATLVDRYSSLLRPLGSQLQSLALASLLAEQDGISQAATALLSSLYRLSGKSDASASWSRSVRATIGTIDLVLDALLSPFLIESGIYSDCPLARHQLAPLDISAQELLYGLDTSPNSSETHLGPHRIPLLLRRLDRLTRVLVTMLSLPTERAVNVPIGELSTLSYRLLLVGKGDLSERADASWRSAWESLGGTATTRAIGCRLVSKLAECTTSRFAPFVTPTLSIIAAAIESGRDPCGRASPDLSVLYATYARLVSACPPSPLTIQKTLEPILKAILADVERIYGRAESHSGSQGQPAKKKSKKKTNQYESDQAWHATPLAHPLDFVLAERALSTLELVLAVVPHFFPAPYLSIVVRALLGLATHPSFTSSVSNVPGSSTVLAALAPGLSSHAPHVAFAARPMVRLRILRCLLSLLPIQRTSAQPTIGLHLAQSLVGILQKLVGCTDDKTGELARTAREGLQMISLLARPRVPPIYLTDAQTVAEAEPAAEASENECDDEPSVNGCDSAPLGASQPQPQYQSQLPRPPSYRAAPAAGMVVEKPSLCCGSGPVTLPESSKPPPVVPESSKLLWESLRQGSGTQKKRKSEDDKCDQVAVDERPVKRREEERRVCNDDDDDDDDDDQEGGFPKLVLDDDDDSCESSEKSELDCQ